MREPMLINPINSAGVSQPNVSPASPQIQADVATRTSIQNEVLAKLQASGQPVGLSQLIAQLEEQQSGSSAEASPTGVTVFFNSPNGLTPFAEGDSPFGFQSMGVVGSPSFFTGGAPVFGQAPFGFSGMFGGDFPFNGAPPGFGRPPGGEFFAHPHPPGLPGYGKPPGFQLPPNGGEFGSFFPRRPFFRLPQEAPSSGNNTTTTTTPTTTPPTEVTTRVNDPNKITIAQIDTFFTDDQNFNHGEEIAKTLLAGGDESRLAGQINLIQYRVDGTGPLDTTMSARTGDALEDIIKRVKAGEDIDAVNMSLQDYRASADSARVQKLISQLADMNVAVDVAAGNAGPTLVNQLTTPDAFVVQSATNGQLNASSSLGNITAESSSTSFATANLTPRIAAMMNAGLSLNQVRALSNVPPISS